MNIKQLNEELRKLLEHNTLNNDDLATLTWNVRKQKFIFRNKELRYDSDYGDWFTVSTNYDSIRDINNGCEIILKIEDTYLKVTITFNNDRGDWEDSIDKKFSLNNFSFYKLNDKVLSYLKKFFKETEKLSLKYDKAVETLKKILSKIKKDQLDVQHNKFDKEIYSDWLYAANVRQMYPAVKGGIKDVVLKNNYNSTKDYIIRGIGLTNGLNIGVFYQLQNGRITHDIFDDLRAPMKEKLIVLNKLIDILKEQVSGKSTLNKDKKDLEQRKELARQAILQFKQMVKKADSYDSIDNIEEYATSYQFTTHYWGQWQGNDYDFQVPTEETHDKLQKICENLQKDYAGLKFSYNVSEKHMITCYVEWS